MCLISTLNRSISTRRHPAQPVSVTILQSQKRYKFCGHKTTPQVYSSVLEEIQVLWSQNYATCLARLLFLCSAFSLSFAICFSPFFCSFLLFFLPFTGCAFRACRILYDERIALDCPLCLLHNNAVSLLWRVFVTTAPVSLYYVPGIGLKNRHGYWLCPGCRRVEITIV